MYAHDLAKQLLAGPDVLVGTAHLRTSSWVNGIDNLTTATVASPTDSDEVEEDETVVVLTVSETSLTGEEMNIHDEHTTAGRG